MSLFDVVRRFGTWRLVLFTGSLLAFLALHLIRIPLVLLALVLETALGLLNDAATRQASAPPRRPVNDFYAHPRQAGGA
ncbi:hypothetical protein OG738_13520 [Amycolatopsis sp. NBC_01488]|uniref:hypothetical protein n=1 Tax=Amycolatopsis sp. NBC_01488 TaxID=2903563 RepID=UPI002E27CF31|nr:hypothetical protein [Amycolatopsis sp. NBC_01488]